MTAGARDRVRSRCLTGGPCRMPRTTTGPRHRGGPTARTRCRMPLRYMVSGMAVRRSARVAGQSEDVALDQWARSSVGSRRSRGRPWSLPRLVEKILEACGRLNALNAATV